MPTTPVPGFITKKEASENYKRSHRQLTRDLTDAMMVQDPKVLENCRLRTEDGQLREGIGVTPKLIDALCIEGKNPVWYLRTTWLEKTYGRRGRARRPSQRHAPDDVAPDTEEGTDAVSRPELVHVLRERIRGLEQDKQDLRDEMKIKNQQIADRVEREKETNALVRDLHNLMADMQQRLLPAPAGRVSEPKAAAYIPADSAKPAPPDSKPPSSAAVVEVDVHSPPAKPEKGSRRRRPKKSKPKKRARRRSTRKLTTKKRTSTTAKAPPKKPSSEPLKSKGLWSRLFPR